MSTQPPIQWLPGVRALTNHPNSVTGLIVSVAVGLLSLHPFMLWKGTTLTFATTHFRKHFVL